MPRIACKQFDFDEWAILAADDPAAFEAHRAALIEAFIDSTPRERQQRLRRLQWKIDRTRECAPNPVAACIRISKMMWDSLLGDGGLLEALEAARGGGRRCRPKSEAKVLAFRRVGEDTARTREH